MQHCLGHCRHSTIFFFFLTKSWTVINFVHHRCSEEISPLSVRKPIIYLSFFLHLVGILFFFFYDQVDHEHVIYHTTSSHASPLSEHVSSTVYLVLRVVTLNISPDLSFFFGIDLSTTKETTWHLHFPVFSPLRQIQLQCNMRSEVSVPFDGEQFVLRHCARPVYAQRVTRSSSSDFWQIIQVISSSI